MGCCTSRRPHAECKTFYDYQMVLDNEEKDLQKMIENIKHDNEASMLDYSNRLFLIKSSLTQLHLKIEEIKEDKELSDQKSKEEIERIAKILDSYYELKDKKFQEKLEDLNSSKADKAKIFDKTNKKSVPSKEFLNEIDKFTMGQVEENEN